MYEDTRLYTIHLLFLAVKQTERTCPGDIDRLTLKTQLTRAHLIHINFLRKTHQFFYQENN